MTVEAEFYVLKRHGDDIFQRSVSIPPGSSENIAFFEQQKVRIVAFCDSEDTQGTIAVLGHSLNKKVRATLYESGDDDLGRRVSVSPLIRLKKGQELSLLLHRGPKKEIFFSLNSGESKSHEGAKPNIPDKLSVVASVV